MKRMMTCELSSSTCRDLKPTENFEPAGSHRTMTVSKHHGLIAVKYRANLDGFPSIFGAVGTVIGMLIVIVFALAAFWVLSFSCHRHLNNSIVERLNRRGSQSIGEQRLDPDLASGEAVLACFRRDTYGPQ